MKTIAKTFEDLPVSHNTECFGFKRSRVALAPDLLRPRLSRQVSDPAERESACEGNVFYSALVWQKAHPLVLSTCLIVRNRRPRLLLPALLMGALFISSGCATSKGLGVDPRVYEEDEVILQEESASTDPKTEYEWRGNSTSTT